jgi:hypothetical protein
MQQKEDDSMDDEGFQFIEPLTEKPFIPRSDRFSRVENIILEFTGSDYKYAAVKGELVEEYKNVKGCARAIGRIASSLKKKGVIKENLRVYSSTDKIYLEKM